MTPSNILLGDDGAVKLSDFGIAKVAQSERTRSKGTKGKAPYMSPEMALGEAVDGRADLFALGVVMFELLAGVRPFDGPTDLATMKNAVEGMATPLGLPVWTVLLAGAHLWPWALLPAESLRGR